MEYEWYIALGAIIISYFIGNISPAILIGRAHGIDIRTQGSGNAGTTNVLRTLGTKAAAATLIIDVLKGVVGVLIGRILGDQDLALMCGSAAFLGHIFPLLFRFKGGKGIATGAGVLLAADWRVGLTCVAAALLMMIATKRVSCGSVVAAIVLPIAMYYFDPHYIWWALALAIIVLYKHRGNIERILKGQEPKFKFSKKGDLVTGDSSPKQQSTDFTSDREGKYE